MLEPCPPGNPKEKIVNQTPTIVLLHVEEQLDCLERKILELRNLLSLKESRSASFSEVSSQAGALRKICTSISKEAISLLKLCPVPKDEVLLRCHVTETFATEVVTKFSLFPAVSSHFVPSKPLQLMGFLTYTSGYIFFMCGMCEIGNKWLGCFTLLTFFQLLAIISCFNKATVRSLLRNFQTWFVVFNACVVLISFCVLFRNSPIS